MKQNKPYVIGLTGGIACGKTHVAGALRAMGVPVLDADAISRSLTAEGGEALPKIRETFGGQVFEGEKLERRALGEIVFQDAQARAALEAIIHPLVIARMQRETQESQALIVGWDVPLLYECGMDQLCDEVWCVYVSPREQLRRLMRRDHLTRGQAMARIQAQQPLDEKKRRADHLIDTGGNLRGTHARARGLLRDLQRRLHFD